MICALNYSALLISAGELITRMVKVELALDSLGFLLGRERFVKAVLAQRGDLTLPMIDLVLAQQLHDLGTY